MNLADYDRTNGTQLEQQVSYVRRRAKELKAYGGEQRLALVANQFSNLSLEQAYNILSPEVFRQEVEEAQSYKKRAKFFQFGRTILGLAPLIVTWGSLSAAVFEYGNYVSTHHFDQSSLPSFLQQWQQGFPHDPLTFFWTGALDVLLLLLFLSFTIFSLGQEYHAHSESEKYALELQFVTDGLLQAVAKAGKTDVASDAEINRIMKFIKMAIAESYQDLEGIIQDARDTIVQTGQTMQNMLQSQISPLLTRFDSNIANFHNDLNTLNTKMTDMATASTTMAKSSTTIATSATDLTSSVQAQTAITKDMDKHLIALNTTEQGVIQSIKDAQKDTIIEISQVAGSMDGAAQAVFNAAQNVDSSSRNMITTATKVEDVGKQLVKMDLNTLTALTDSLSRVLYEAGNVATTLNQVNASLKITVQELQAVVRGVPLKKTRKKRFGII